MTKRASTTIDVLGPVADLIEAGNVDTVYRDVYRHRAATLLSPVFPAEELRRVEDEREELARLPLMIARAMERADWPRVKELSGRCERLRAEVEGLGRRLEIARGVYAVSDVRLDPFSPGLLPFVRIAAKELPGLRARAIERLGLLERADAPWKEFYARRRAALQALVVTTADSSVETTAAADPREAAQRALKAGDMKALARLAETLTQAAAGEAAGRREASRGQEARPSADGPSAPDLLTTFAAPTLDGAKRLGLVPRRLTPQRELTSLRHYLWNPLVADDSGCVDVKSVPLPAGTPEALRERLEMLMIHPMVNSGGARYVPTLVAEDVLVEDFPDPKEGDDAPASALLDAVGLATRRGLSRLAIEAALLARGADVVERDLGLDPRAFRLVCIPADVHLRLGEAEHWGRQPCWTHFDGYLVMPDARLRALAGGHAQYGGLYNMLGINRDYDSDRVIARFAVVRRERMAAW
jgi:hypothetical protein